MPEKPNESRSRGISRRSMLRGAAALGGAAALTGAGFASQFLPRSLNQAIAQAATDPQRFDISQVKHVVLIMLENRSFDHYFGTLRGVRGFDDAHAIKLPNGNPVFYQPDPLNPLGYLLPWHLDTKTTSAASVPQNDHDFEPMHLALAGGAMDGFIQSQITGYGNAPYTMGYYTRADLPFDYALAGTFTICDNYFHSVLSNTNSNRTMAISGTIDPDGKLGGPSISDTNDYEWITYPEQLSAAGVSWRNYQDVSSSLNPLHVFKTFQNAKSGSELYELGIAPHKGLFEQDVANDNLPTVSWITVPSNMSEHPSQAPAIGAQYLYGKLNAIASNPEVWAKTVVIVHYDEGDGKFDHVRPPMPLPGTPGEFITGTSSDGTLGRDLSVGPGFRVPCIVISPWTVGGRVCSDPFDHTSVLQFLGKVTGVAPTNVSDWRLKTFGDMTSVFHPGPPVATMPPLYNLTQWVADTNYQLANYPPPVPPTTNQSMPHQEPGGRPHVGFGYTYPA